MKPESFFYFFFVVHFFLHAHGLLIGLGKYDITGPVVNVDFVS